MSVPIADRGTAPLVDLSGLPHDTGADALFEHPFFGQRYLGRRGDGFAYRASAHPDGFWKYGMGFTHPFAVEVLISGWQPAAEGRPGVARGEV